MMTNSMGGFSSRRRVAVVGAGVTGCATAYELARSGFDVTLIERAGIGAQASRWNAGNLNPLHGTPANLLEDALDAFRLHSTVQVELRELGCADYELLPVNRLFLGCDASDLVGLEATLARFNATAGFCAHWLDGESLRRLEPRLAGEIGFGVMTEGCLSVESLDFTRSLAGAAKRLGATIRHEPVIGTVVCGDRVTGLETDKRVVGCDEVVFATGPWAMELRAWIGIDIGVTPVKGELLLLQMPGEPLRYDLTLGQACLYRRRGGQTWVGVTMSDSGLECVPTEKAKELLMEGAARMLPEIRGARLLEHAAALRPMAASGPIAERAPGWQNVCIANGGGAKGVLLSVGIARKIRDILVKEHAASQRTSVA